MGKFRTAARQALEALRAGISYWRILRAGGRPVVVRVDVVATGALSKLERLIGRVYAVLDSAPVRAHHGILSGLTALASDAVVAVDSLRHALKLPKYPLVLSSQAAKTLALLGRKRVTR